MISLPEFKNTIIDYFTVPEDVKQLGKKIKYVVVETAKKIYDFLKANKSLVFFGLTVLFAYYMAPTAAFEYLDYFGYSLKDILIEGIGFGSSMLAIANLLNLKEITKHADDRINYLFGVSNVCQILLCPTQGLISSVATSGLVIAKTAYKSVFEIGDNRVFIAIPRDQKAFKSQEI